jgi:hypothetical protein
VTVADWQGSAFVLSTATGKTEIVDNLVHLWIAAERLLGQPCDPLDGAVGPGAAPPFLSRQCDHDR